MNMDADDLLFLERISDYVIDKNPETKEQIEKRAKSKKELERKVEFLSQMIEETDYCVQLAKMRLKEIKQKKLATRNLVK